jgi:hypothetical protein
MHFRHFGRRNVSRQEGCCCEEEKLFEEKKAVNPSIAGFIESMAKTNTEKITKEILEGLYEDTGDSDSYDAESGGEDSEDWPWRPSHAIFGKSSIKQSHLENMRGRYFRDMSIVRAGGDNNVPAPEENEVVIHRSFFKAGLRFPLSRFVVKVLKTYQIFLHQMTPEAILRMGVFVWAVRSQGIEPSAKCFYSMHELLYETKAMGKEQYHNNFGCYGFIARPNASHQVPTLQKRWPGNWMEEWFYVTNDLTAREDIKEVIMRPIWSRFGLRKPKVEIDDAAEVCQKAFNTVCFFIGTRDLIQEHIAFRVWPLAESWEMPKETITKPSEGELVRLKYTFRYGDKFDEPNDDWLKCIEATSDELLGAYSKAEDNALSATFGGRGKKRLNRVFDAIGFVYPDYCYLLRGQGKKRKATTSAMLDEPMPKGKKLKVLTHRPRYIEPAAIPEFGEGTSLASKTKETIPPVQRTEEPDIMPKVPTVKVVETKVDKAEKPETEEITKIPEVLSPPAKAIEPKVQMGSVVTPKRRRMVNVLDVLETTETLNPASTGKVAEASKAQTEVDTKQIEAEAAVIEAGTDAGPSEPAEKKPAKIEEKATEEKATEQISAEKVATPAPEALKESIDYIIRHASKGLSQKEKREAQHYTQKLKYPKGALVFNGSGEEDFLYCLPDNKEISICREIGRSIRFPKLEDGLSILSKDELTDSLAYNSLKV